jgi:DNA-binding protein HU-beta
MAEKNAWQTIVDDAAEKAGISLTAGRKFAKELIEGIKAHLVSGKPLQILGFVNFDVALRGERDHKNPQSGEVITKPAHKAITAKVSKSVNKAVGAIKLTKDEIAKANKSK